MKKRYENLKISLIRLGGDVICTSGEVTDEASWMDNFFKDIWS